MDRILDVNQQPPYVEVYSDAPLMCASLVNTRQALVGWSPTEQVHWCHNVQCQMDDIASALGLYKVKVLSVENQTCLFAISPDMPPRQQTEVMLHAAQQLRDALTQMHLPTGDRLTAKITIHAGKYAGAVVGRSAWTYDLFGEDVQLLLDMDRAATPNTIQVSDAALSLMSQRPAHLTPGCKVPACNGGDIQLHCWTPEVSACNTASQQPVLTGVQQPSGWQATSGVCKPTPVQPLSVQDVLMQPSPQPVWQTLQQLHQLQPQQQHQWQQLQQPPELAAAIAAAKNAARSTHWQGSKAAAAAAQALQEPGLPAAMQQDLRFRDPSLEATYVAAQSESLASMDLLFILLNLAVMACGWWSNMSSSSGSSSRWLQQMAGAWGQWLLLPVAAVWLLTGPGSYGRVRERLWVAHRVLSGLHMAASLLLAGLQHHTGAAASVVFTASTLHLHRGKALALMAETLGLKVRLQVHMLVSTFTCVLLSFSTLWYCSRSSGDGLRELPLWELLQHLLLGWAAPTLVLYLWEADDRLRFMDSLQQKQRSKVGEPLHKKSKEV